MNNTPELVFLASSFIERVEVFEVLFISNTVNFGCFSYLFQYLLHIFRNQTSSSGSLPRNVLNHCHVGEIIRFGVIEEIQVPNFLPIFADIIFANCFILFCCDFKSEGCQHLPKLFGGHLQSIQFVPILEQSLWFQSIHQSMLSEFLDYFFCNFNI